VKIKTNREIPNDNTMYMPLQTIPLIPPPPHLLFCPKAITDVMKLFVNYTIQHEKRENQELLAICRGLTDFIGLPSLTDNPR
jgi:hypothetical protein